MCDLSIILPTCERARLLEQCLWAIHAGTHRNYEVIVVDGASADDTPRVLERAGQFLGDRLKVIREERREGFVRAANKGFRAANGAAVAWLNDDARPLPGALDMAVCQLNAAGPEVGQLALFHRFQSRRNIAYQTFVGRSVYCLCHVRGTLYANFALMRRQVLERLDYFDERFFLCGADPDLSLKAWHAGLRVEPAFGCIIEHAEHQDDRRAMDSGRGADDNARLFEKWDLPDKNPHYNDFDPMRPCTLRGLRQPAAAA